MPIDQGTFFYWSEEFIEMANELDVKTLEELRKVAYRLSIDPDLNFEERIRQFSEKASNVWLGSAETWIESSAASAYLRGIQMEDKELFDMISNPKNEENPLPRPRFSRHARTPGSPSDQARAILGKYENHWDHYGRYENTFKEEMRRIRLPFRNSSVQGYRDIAALTQKSEFMNASAITRREMAQSILNEFADRGINVVQFPSGHKMSIEAFAHRESRAYLQHIAVEGQINRAVERGYDLVRINSYAGASPMCAPHQGNVYSLTGSSDKYPDLQDAIHDGTYEYGSGLYHDYSYDEKTEAYTNSGWKHIKDLSGQERILSLNPDTLEPEWVNIARTHNYHHNGNMIHLTSNSFDLMVTDDHDLFIGYSGRDGDDRVRKYKFCKAEDAIQRAFFSQLRIPKWSGTSAHPPIKGLTERQFAYLLGWYLSEGYCEKPNERWTKVCIRQEGTENVDHMRSQLEDMGFKYSNGRFWVYNSEWAEYLQQFGHSHEKYIPQWLKDRQSWVIEVFMDAFLRGDGSTSKYKYQGYDTSRDIFYTSSKRLAEDLGECMIKTGFYPSFSMYIPKGTETVHHNGTYSSNHDIHVIRRNKTKESYYRNSPSNKGTGLNSEIIDWNDRAYCVTLEKNHVLWVRRNGKTTWSGNCGHFQSTYIPGISPRTTLTDDPNERRILEEMGESEGNKFIYQTRQTQRDIEYQIRKYKRRKSVAMDERERARMNKRVQFWQAKQREHVSKYSFLKRNYAREAA